MTSVHLSQPEKSLKAKAKWLVSLYSVRMNLYQADQGLKHTAKSFFSLLTSVWKEVTLGLSSLHAKCGDLNVTVCSLFSLQLPQNIERSFAN